MLEAAEDGARRLVLLAPDVFEGDSPADSLSEALLDLEARIEKDVHHRTVRLEHLRGERRYSRVTRDLREQLEQARSDSATSHLVRHRKRGLRVIAMLAAAVVVRNRHDSPADLADESEDVVVVDDRGRGEDRVLRRAAVEEAGTHRLRREPAEEIQQAGRVVGPYRSNVQRRAGAKHYIPCPVLGIVACLVRDGVCRFCHGAPRVVSAADDAAVGRRDAMTAVTQRARVPADRRWPGNRVLSRAWLSAIAVIPIPITSSGMYAKR